jgi:hypothetical protein
MSWEGQHQLMKYIKNIGLVITSVLVIFACQKESALELNSDFIGNWKHNQKANKTVYLQIEKDSKGYIEYYENGKFKSDTQNRKWLIKKDKLYFGWLTSKDEKFSIDKYPSVASSMIINNYDTILIGETYIILDGNYYKN